MSSFGWLLDLLPVESVTPAPKGVATGVTETVAVHGGVRTPADEVPHPPHVPHPKYAAGDDCEFADNYARFWNSTVKRVSRHGTAIPTG